MKKIILPFLIVVLASCKKEKVEGIVIGNTLLVHQSLSENRKMVGLINQALRKNEDAIIEIIDIPNGGAASSYDLGYVLTQIIYRIGENDFVNILRTIPNNERTGIRGLIEVGLEYGDNDYDGKSDNKRMEFEFPELTEILNE